MLIYKHSLKICLTSRACKDQVNVIVQDEQHLELQCKASEIITAIKNAKIVHVRFIASGEKRIAMNETGASSRFPIMSNQASRCEDKAALTTYAL